MLRPWNFRGKLGLDTPLFFKVNKLLPGYYEFLLNLKPKELGGVLDYLGEPVS